MLENSIYNLTEALDEAEHRYFDLVQLGWSTKTIALTYGVEHQAVLDVLTNARNRLGFKLSPQDAEGVRVTKQAPGVRTKDFSHGNKR